MSDEAYELLMVPDDIGTHAHHDLFYIEKPYQGEDLTYVMRGGAVVLRNGQIEEVVSAYAVNAIRRLTEDDREGAVEVEVAHDFETGRTIIEPYNAPQNGDGRYLLIPIQEDDD